MKNIRTASGPFSERPHYEFYEIEAICTEALRSTGLYPDQPAPIRIDRFIEKRFGVSPRYEPLPEGVLGFTKFESNDIEEIVITTALDEEGNKCAERRVRSTLAHEGGHGLLHAYLFHLGTKPASLFEDEGEKPEILCRDVQGAMPEKCCYDGRWWEFQANKAIGGLLMPRRLVQHALKPLTKRADPSRHWTVDSSQRNKAVLSLSEIFDVNPIVARIRLDELFPPRAERQFER